MDARKAIAKRAKEVLDDSKKFDKENALETINWDVLYLTNGGKPLKTSFIYRMTKDRLAVKCPNCGQAFYLPKALADEDDFPEGTGGWTECYQRTREGVVKVVSNKKSCGEHFAFRFPSPIEIILELKTPL